MIVKCSNIPSTNKVRDISHAFSNGRKSIFTDFKESRDAIKLTKHAQRQLLTL